MSSANSCEPHAPTRRDNENGITRTSDPVRCALTNQGELSSETAGRWDGRFVGQREPAIIQDGQKPEVCWGAENERGPFRKKLKFLGAGRKVTLLLGFPALGDVLANVAGMFAVERTPHSFSEGRSPKVVREHRCPRHGLEQCPMRACRANQRENQQSMANPLEHAATIHQNCAAKSRKW